MTSRFAPVAPVRVHQRLAEAGVLGDYHLLLAHQVLAGPTKHADFYRKLDAYIIMDNSLIELGYPMPVEDVVGAAEMVGASIIVLPDILGDRIGTLNKSAKAMDEFNHLTSKGFGRRKVKALGVAQGKTFNDVFSCARDMVKELGVGMVSIPRHVTEKIGSRIKLVQKVSSYGKPIHLLGFSNNIFDDMSALSVPGVTGIDSAVPIWYGLQGFSLSGEPPVNADFGKRPSDYEDQTDINTKVIQNIRTVERWANIAKDTRRGV